MPRDKVLEESKRSNSTDKDGDKPPEDPEHSASPTPFPPSQKPPKEGEKDDGN